MEKQIDLLACNLAGDNKQAKFTKKSHYNFISSSNKLPHFEVFFSGHCNPNPGFRIIYTVLILSSDGSTIHQISEQIEENFSLTSSCAEFSAVITAQQYLIRNGYENNPIRFFGSNEIVIQQLNSLCEISHDKIYARYARVALKLKEVFSYITFEWICKQNNKAKSLDTKSFMEARV